MEPGDCRPVDAGHERSGAGEGVAAHPADAADAGPQHAPVVAVRAPRAQRRGRRYISPDTADLLLRQGATWEAPPHESLSDREYQVLRLIGSGQTISDIGRDLGLSVKTVSTYRSRVLEKFGMRTNAELMRYAVENHLLET